MIFEGFHRFLNASVSQSETYSDSTNEMGEAKYSHGWVELSKINESKQSKASSQGLNTSRG